MRYEADSPERYIEQLPEPRKAAVRRLRDAVRRNLPEGFEEIMQYGMIGYVVPHSIYPAGYRANPKEPLPFMGIASQKQYISLYHMGLYVFPDLLKWFRTAYEKAGAGKPDMGKSCIHFRKEEKIPFPLIEELASKISVQEYIARASEV